VIYIGQAQSQLKCLERSHNVSGQI